VLYSPAVLRALALLAVLAAAPPASAIEGSFEVGYGWLSQHSDRATIRTDGGVALGLRVEGRVSEQIGLGVNFGWGLADWDRAGEYIDAGNRAGSWTTDQFAKVERWATEKDAKGSSNGLRLMGAVFADAFLLLSYAAVPACYMGSAGGATSWLQLDGSATFHLAPAGADKDGWLEAGLGAATLPIWNGNWRTAVGPVGGLGLRYRWLRLGAHVLWSPTSWNESRFGGSVVTGALTVGFAL
jgi:hypothetical protein